MYEINIDSVAQWYRGQQDKVRKPIYIDVDCPHCAKSMANKMINTNDWHGFSHVLLTRYPCAICENTSYLFLIPQDKDVNVEGPESKLFIYPSPSFVPELSDALKDMSPRLERIYEQALRAEASGFDELAGMGYRKALEFLIKGYAIKNNPDDAKAIKKKRLAECIETYLDNPKLKIAAKATSMIGNDETHLERRYPQYDLPALKRFLKTTIDWLETELSIDSLFPKPERNK